MRQIILVIHNVRSAHNVGSLLRSADGLGVKKVLISGYSPYPKHANDDRLPHLADKINSQIHKTALGAEDSVDWQKIDDLDTELSKLKTGGYVLCGLEQVDKSISLDKYQSPDKLVLVVGNEVEGIDAVLLEQMDEWLEIPMHGKKESFNVAVAGAIAIYHLARA